MRCIFVSPGPDVLMDTERHLIFTKEWIERCFPGGRRPGIMILYYRLGTPPGVGISRARLWDKGLVFI